MSRELIVLSHLRWDFVWQRPQHLISRIARTFGRVWFIEEPQAGSGAEPALCVERDGAVDRVWLELPSGLAPAGFDSYACERYRELLPKLFSDDVDRTVWLYTPMSIDIARSLSPSLLVYDVMDDLAAFRFAAPALVLRQRQALRAADVVFAGGRSLHTGIADHRPDAHCFPSGVEPHHYAPAIEERSRSARARPVAGYVGVIDERLDLDLLDGLALRLSDWDIEVVGPVRKINESDLPRRANLRYPGSRSYTQLPSVMAGFDVALMPFALNEATRSISPTKTLEYLAAGLPVVSTPVPDVVSEYGDVVHIAEDIESFAAGCSASLERTTARRADVVRSMLRDHDWDTIAARMTMLMNRATSIEETA